MKKLKIDQLMNNLASLGVIAGLVFLALELQQNSELMRIQIGQARADAAMVANAQTFDSPYIPAILVKIDHGLELNEEEWHRYLNYFRSQNRNQDNVLSQFEAGMLGENVPRSIVNFVCLVIGSSEQPLQAWEITRLTYSDAYIEFVEDTLGECRQTERP